MLLKIRPHGELAWERVSLAVRLSAPLGNHEAADLHEAVMRWYQSAVTGKFGGHARFLSDLTVDDRGAAFRVNFGTAGKEALNALLKAVEDWSVRDVVEVGEVVIGEPDQEEDGPDVARHLTRAFHP